MGKDEVSVSATQLPRGSSSSHLGLKCLQHQACLHTVTYTQEEHVSIADSQVCTGLETHQDPPSFESEEASWMGGVFYLTYKRGEFTIPKRPNWKERSSGFPAAAVQNMGENNHVPRTKIITRVTPWHKPSILSTFKFLERSWVLVTSSRERYQY